MGLVIGMDEAGYGPNLGPLVVSTTVWEVPGHPSETDLWEAQAEMISQSRVGKGDSRLHVADSKQVYTPARGIGALEKSVLGILALAGRLPASFGELRQTLAASSSLPADGEPWFEGCDLDLPQQQHTEPLEELGTRWQECCRRQGIQLRALRSDVVLTERFNRLTRECDSKGVALSRISLRLLRQVWDPEDPEPTLIIADKHGGRNRYDHLLYEVLDGRMVFRQRESRDLSCYRVGTTEVRFQTKAEAHFPVAVASMVSKYVRELAMILFNRYWCNKIAGLKPTKGYPTDARRFKKEIAETSQQLGIPDDVLWRER